MAHFNKYDIRHNEVHETLNKPIHKFINVGNGLITFILLIFIALFSWLKIGQHIEQNCFIKLVDSGVNGSSGQALIIMQKPLSSVRNKHGIFSVIVDGNSAEIQIDSIIDNGRVIRCRLPLTYIKKTILLHNNTTGVFAIVKLQKESVTFFQVFYRRLIHL